MEGDSRRSGEGVGGLKRPAAAPRPPYARLVVGDELGVLKGERCLLQLASCQYWALTTASRDVRVQVRVKPTLTERASPPYSIPLPMCHKTQADIRSVRKCLPAHWSGPCT
jgi:hypothetical protein